MQGKTIVSLTVAKNTFNQSLIYDKDNYKRDTLDTFNINVKTRIADQ